MAEPARADEPAADTPRTEVAHPANERIIVPHLVELLAVGLPLLSILLMSALGIGALILTR